MDKHKLLIDSEYKHELENIEKKISSEKRISTVFKQKVIRGIHILMYLKYIFQ